MSVMIMRAAKQHRGRRLSKSFRLTSQGFEQIETPPRVTWWQPDERQDPTSLEEMRALLDEVERDPTACLIFGVELTDKAHKQLDERGCIERLTAESRGDERTLRAVPSRVLPIDLDDAPVQLTERPAEDMRRAVLWGLPNCFHTAGAVYQLSGSCGLKGNTIKGHLFYLLDEPRLLSEVKTLGQQGREHRFWLVDQQDRHTKTRHDEAALNAGQIIYTARPHVIGAADPIKQRAGCLPGSDLLSLPHIPKAQIIRPKPRLASVIGGGEATARKVLEDWASRLAGLSDGQGRRQSAYNTAFKVGGFVGAGRLDYEEARLCLLGAAHANGSTQDHKKIEEEIEKGLRKGARFPLEAKPFESKGKAHTRARTREALRPSTQTERAAVVRDKLSKALARLDAEPTSVAVVKLPTGVGKSYGSLALAARQVAQGRPVVFAARDNAKAQSALDELMQIIKEGGAPSIMVEKIESKTHLCNSIRAKHYAAHPGEQALMSEMRAQGVGGSQLCDKLSCSARKTCPVYAAGKVKRELEGQLSICTHAMLPHLQQPLEALDRRALLIIDEAPQEVFSEGVGFDDLQALPYEMSDSQTRDLYSRWRCQVRWRALSRDVLKPLLNALTTAAQQAAKGAKHSGLIEPQELYQAIKGALSEQAVRDYLKADIELPQLALEHYRRRHNRLIKPSALRSIKGLLEQVCDGGSADYRLRYSPQGEVLALERWVSCTLPTAAEVVVLDATADQELWAHTCSTQGRALAWFEDDSLQPHEMPGLWWKTGAYKTTQLFAKGGGLSKRGKRALDHLAHFLEPYLAHLPDGAEVGVGTHLKVQRLIEAGLQGEGPLTGSRLCSMLSRFALIIGHHHADEVGSNALRDVSYLIIIGTPRFDLGHMIAQGLQLGLSEEQARARAQRRSMQSLEQWAGRMRHYVVAGKRLIYAGDAEPPQVKGVEWSTQAAVGGITAEHRDEIERTARAALHLPDGLSKQMLFDWGASAWVARQVWRQLKDEGAQEVKVQQGRKGFMRLCAPLEDSSRPCEVGAYNIYTEGSPLCAAASHGQSEVAEQDKITPCAAASHGQSEVAEQAQAEPHRALTSKPGVKAGHRGKPSPSHLLHIPESFMPAQPFTSSGPPFDDDLRALLHILTNPSAPPAAVQKSRFNQHQEVHYA